MGEGEGINTSDVGVALIKQFEGLRLTAYRDSVGILTIGYGHTGPDVFFGQQITEAQATELLRRDLKAAEQGVLECVRAPLTQGMFDALVSFTFNLGGQKLRTSSLLRYVNSRQYRAARDAFAVWCMAGGRPLPGLQRRRAAEAELFERDGFPE